MNKGKYIVLEGPEGVGKTTQIEELARRLQAAGLPVRTLREPDSQSDLTARALRQLTQDPRYPMNTNTEVLLYNAARSQSLQVIKNSVEQGVICIVDRNYLTTLAIQYYGRGDVPDYETINRIINFAVNGVEPDLCIVMDAPVQTLKQRAQSRGQGERFDNLDEAFLERVRAGYLWEAKQRDLPVVFATEDSEAVANDIWKLVSATLALRDNKSAATNEPVSIKQILEAKQQAAVAVEPPFQLETIPDTPTTTTTPSRYYVPNDLPEAQLALYHRSLESLLQAYHELEVKLPAGDDDVLTAARLALPVAALIDPPHAASIMANALLDERLSSFAHDGSHPAAESTDQIMAQLVDYWPRSEFNALPRLLYAASNQSIRALAREADSWSYDQKAGAIELAVSSQENPGLDAVGYSIELHSDYATLQSLRQRGLHVIHQQLTPRYGYDVPAAIEQAGLEEEYQRCFDTSLQLYSQLQAVGSAAAAQLVTLGGHKLRALCTMRASQLDLLRADDNDRAAVKTLLAGILTLIGSVHPLLTQTLRPDMVVA